MAGYLLPVSIITQYFTNAGAILNGGKVYIYDAGTTTPRTTYTTSALSVANDNPHVLDAYGRTSQEFWVASGITVKVVVKTSADVTLITLDNIPALNDISSTGAPYWAGTSGGTASAMTLTFSNGPSAYAAGNRIAFKSNTTNTGAVTINVNGLGAKAIQSRGAALIGGEIVANKWYELLYDGTQFQMLPYSANTQSQVSVASAATLDLDAATPAPIKVINVTGSTGPTTAVTLTDGHIAILKFASTPTWTHGASLILLGGVSRTMVAGDTCILVGEASGVVREVDGGKRAFLNVNQTFTKAQGSAAVQLTDAATVAVDASLSNHFYFTIGGNRTLGQPTNPTDGQSIVIYITQDGTGSRTLAYHADWLFAGGVDPTLSTAAGTVDQLVAHYRSTTTKWHAALNKAWA